MPQRPCISSVNANKMLKIRSSYSNARNFAQKLCSGSKSYAFCSLSATFHFSSVALCLCFSHETREIIAWKLQKRFDKIIRKICDVITRIDELSFLRFAARRKLVDSKTTRLSISCASLLNRLPFGSRSAVARRWIGANLLFWYVQYGARYKFTNHIWIA